MSIKYSISAVENERGGPNMPPRPTRRGVNVWSFNIHQHFKRYKPTTFGVNIEAVSFYRMMAVSMETGCRGGWCWDRAERRGQRDEGALLFNNKIYMTTIKTIFERWSARLIGWNTHNFPGAVDADGAAPETPPPPSRMTLSWCLKYTRSLSTAMPPRFQVKVRIYAAVSVRADSGTRSTISESKKNLKWQRKSGDLGKEW